MVMRELIRRLFGISNVSSSKIEELEIALGYKQSKYEEYYSHAMEKLATQYALDPRYARPVVWDQEYNIKHKYKEQAILPNVRKATKQEYQTWLDGYILNGGKTTHRYNYSFSQSDIYIATRNIKLISLYGSSSMSIIVPNGIEVTGSLGHSDLYYMTDFTTSSYPCIPIYADMEGWIGEH